MARGFGATVGVSTGDKCNTGLMRNLVRASYFMWLRVNATASVQIMMRHGVSAGTPYAVIYFPNSGSIATFRIIRSYTGNATAFWDYVTTGFVIGTWTTLGLSIDGTNSTFSANTIGYSGFKRQVMTPTGGISGSVVDLTGKNFNIGSDEDGTSATFDGTLAHVAVWDGILSDSELYRLAAGTLPSQVRPASLISYWPLGPSYSALQNQALPGGAGLTLIGGKVQADPPDVNNVQMGIIKPWMLRGSTAPPLTGTNANRMFIPL